MSVMKTTIAMAAALVVGLGLLGGGAGSAVAQGGQQIYGHQMMTEQERLEYRARMRAATSQEERERIRAEHHERMRERARERGITLPDAPPATGMHKGQGMGQGMGKGMGKGGGKGG